MIALLLQGVSFGYAAGITPGPLQAFLLTQTLQRGWRHAIWIVLSPLFSDGPIVALILLVLRGASDGLLRVIGLIGGAFVLYIASGLFRQIRSGEFERVMVAGQGADAAAVPLETPFTVLRKAIGINALGPGPWLFWSTAMGPVVIAAWRDAPPTAITFVLGFYITFLGIMAAQVVIFHQARRLGPKAIRVALWIGLAAMLLFAARLWWHALMG
jgi:threonine/homoserine/homoserine lactone efflux protein